MIGGARTGLGVLADGMRMLRRERSLWPLALTPALFASIAVCLAAAGVWAYADWIQGMVAGWLPNVEAGAWYSWLWVGPLELLLFLLRWLLFLFAAALAVALAFLLANVAAAPFLDRLSQRVEAIVRGVPPEGTDRPLWVEIRHTMSNELRRLLFFGGIWLGIAMIGLVPGVQILTPLLFAAFTVTFLPLEYSGCALDRRLIPFKTRRRWVRGNLPLMAGFGGGAFLTFLVPGLNFVMVPALVVAGTLLVLRHGPAPEPAQSEQNAA